MTCCNRQSITKYCYLTKCNNYFTVKELKEIQSSNDPFSHDEINDIMIQELEKDNYMDIDCDVVNYCLELLNNTENTMCAE